MGITIKLSADYKDYTDNAENISVKGKTIQECLVDLVAQYPRLRELLVDPYNQLSAVIVLNGEALTAKDMDRAVQDGAEITIFPLIYGG